MKCAGYELGKVSVGDMGAEISEKSQHVELARGEFTK